MAPTFTLPEEELGRGGFAIVYLAWDLVLRRTVAIKRLRSDLSASDSLWREAAVALDLAHEGVVRVLHYEPRTSSGGPFLVQEHVTWPTGEQWIADAGNMPLPTGVVLGIGLSLCETLAFAHGQGVLHLDIKPGNVFVDPAGERAKLADFGLARILDRGAPKAVQLRGTGTPQYMAPEQWQSGSKIAATTDIYQLAATLWDFLTGEPPDRRTHPPAGIDRFRSAVLQAVEAGLSSDPASRPATAREFAARLAAAS